MAQVIDLETRYYFNDLIDKSRFRSLTGQAREAKVQEMYQKTNTCIMEAWINALSPYDRQSLSIMEQSGQYNDQKLIDFIKQHTPNRDATTKQAMADFARDFVRS